MYYFLQKFCEVESACCFKINVARQLNVVYLPKLGLATDKYLDYNLAP